MAQVINYTHFHKIEAALTSVVNYVTALAVCVSEARARKDAFEALSALTDDELRKQYNINRSEIASYIFRDKLV